PLTIRRVLEGKAPVIEGTGQQTRDFTFVVDTARLALDLTETEAAWGQTFNIAAGVETPISELISSVCHLLDYRGPVERVPARAGDHRRHLGDTSRARKLVSFDALTPLHQALAATVEWYARRPVPAAAG